MSQSVSQLERNTLKDCSRARRWIIVINNWEEKDLVKIVSLSQCNYVVGKEVGEKGTRHLQCYLEFPNQMRFNTLKRMFPTGHFEKATHSAKANVEYCTKGGDYITNMKIPKPLHVLSYEQLYPWQKDIEDMIHQDPDDRTIYWYWCDSGNTGKTALIKRLCSRYRWCTFSTCVKSADILTQASLDVSAYLFNFSRSTPDFNPYQALECLKDGLVSDCKLKKSTNNIIMNPPHVICFANKPPAKNKLSADRWKIIRLDTDLDELSDDESD